MTGLTNFVSMIAYKTGLQLTTCNLPTDVTETALREHFPEALQVILPCDEETSERLG